MLRLLTVALFCLLPMGGVHALEVRVGPSSDPACDEDSVMDALSTTNANGPGNDIIKVADNGGYPDSLILIGAQNVTIEGGYSDCSDTTPSAVPTTITGGDGTLPPLLISPGTSSHVQINLVNLDIVGGDGPFQRKGGGIFVGGDVDLLLRNTHVRNGSAGYGGGIYVHPDGSVLLLLTDHSIVANNTALISGGGIHCSGSGNTVQLISAGIYNNVSNNDAGSSNETAGDGGAATVINGCSLYQYGEGGFDAVSGNTAINDGGAYFLRNARLGIYGSANDAAMVISNKAYNGGAIAIDDDLGISDSEITILDAWINDNHAEFQGGAIAMLAGGTLMMGRSLPGTDCHHATRCSRLYSNGVPFSSADPVTGRGGALFVDSGAVAKVFGTYIENNHGITSSVLWQEGSADVHIDSSVIRSNQGVHAIQADLFTSAALVLSWSTLLDNANSSNAVASVEKSTTSSVTFRVYGSIFGDDATYGVHPSGLQPEVTCVARDPGMAALGGTLGTYEFELASPYGVNADGRILDASQPIVDYCNAAYGGRLLGDIDGEETLSDAARINVAGIHDLGADELQVALPDAVFADGFED